MSKKVAINQKRFKVIGTFIFISFLSWLGFILIYEKPEQLRPSESARNLYNSIWLLIVFSAGYVCLRKVINPSLLKLWIFCYSFIAACLLLLFLYSKLMHGLDSDFKKLIGSVRLFFCSPLPFMIFFLFQNIIESLHAKR